MFEKTEMKEVEEEWILIAKSLQMNVKHSICLGSFREEHPPYDRNVYFISHGFRGFKDYDSSICFHIVQITKIPDWNASMIHKDHYIFSSIGRFHCRTPERIHRSDTSDYKMSRYNFGFSFNTSDFIRMWNLLKKLPYQYVLTDHTHHLIQNCNLFCASPIRSLYSDEFVCGSCEGSIIIEWHLEKYFIINQVWNLWALTDHSVRNSFIQLFPEEVLQDVIILFLIK